MSEFENDLVLLEQLKAEDQRAFDQLYHTYRHWLLVSAITILRNETEAEEVVQEFFIDFWQNQRYNNITVYTGNFMKNFLFVSIRNRCFNHLARDETRRRRFSRIMLTDKFSLPLNHLENEELRNRLDSAIKQLTPGQSAVFKMAYLSNKTRKEIAAEMGISTETVKKQIALALKTLRDYLKETENL